LIISRHHLHQEKRLPGRKSYRSYDGFGSLELQRKIAMLLRNKGWKDDDIAREMMLKPEDVRTLLKKNHSSDD
ncbi:MAG: hypothetical protein JW784_05560, partial [Candidatus Cloacimonetes bacterium]|nr:hypothetical protein [Candidatus Cloacimonadota bacterium]